MPSGLPSIVKSVSGLFRRRGAAYSVREGVKAARQSGVARFRPGTPTSDAKAELGDAKRRDRRQVGPRMATRGMRLLR